MNTNLLATLLITVSTNWTGSGDPTREVGAIVTNYEAQCVFECKTNVFQLEKRYADTVAWRTTPTRTYGLTNGSLHSITGSNLYPHYWYNNYWFNK